MEWLNYHHLLYFWVAARDGGVSRASEALHLTHSTISGQLRQLEKSLGTKLFSRKGRGLELTEAGRLVYRYADEIFALGKELQDAVRGRPTGNRIRLVVGIADVMPKLVVRSLLKPALKSGHEVRVVCREDKAERLFADLAAFELDVILTDAPLPPGIPLRAFNHLLGECAVGVFGTSNLAKRYRKGFPGSLSGAPFLMPTENTQLRRSLDQWFDANEIKPSIEGEFEDSALLKVFGQEGIGLFAAPVAIAKEIERQYDVEFVGELPEIKERFFAISPEKRHKNPAVVALCETARSDVFGKEGSR